MICPDAAARQVPPLRRGVLEEPAGRQQQAQQGTEYQGTGILTRRGQADCTNVQSALFENKLYRGECEMFILFVRFLHVASAIWFIDGILARQIVRASAKRRVVNSLVARGV